MSQAAFLVTYGSPAATREAAVRRSGCGAVPPRWGMRASPLMKASNQNRVRVNSPKFPELLEKPAIIDGTDVVRGVVEGIKNPY
jgi:hypothetical protein